MAFIPFIRGHIYNRKQDLHAEFGGSSRSGIASCKNHPFVFLFTGSGGESYGYRDEWRDGLFLYSGEGQVGDQQMKAGNRAILEHAKKKKELLLFSKAGSGHVIFEGKFHCVGWETRFGPDRNGNTRQLIIFHLKPEDAAEEVDGGDVQALPSIAEDISQLRGAAYAAASPPKQVVSTKESSKYSYERSAAIKRYVLKRSKGICEGCGSPAPFLTKAGLPYLEAHHIHRLSDRGLDDPRHVAAICPNCHRRVHHGSDGEAFDDALLEKVKDIESSLEKGIIALA